MKLLNFRNFLILVILLFFILFLFTFRRNENRFDKLEKMLGQEIHAKDSLRDKLYTTQAMYVQDTFRLNENIADINSRLYNLSKAKTKDSLEQKNLLLSQKAKFEKDKKKLTDELKDIGVQLANEKSKNLVSDFSLSKELNIPNVTNINEDETSIPKNSKYEESTEFANQVEYLNFNIKLSRPKSSDETLYAILANTYDGETTIKTSEYILDGNYIRFEFEGLRNLLKKGKFFANIYYKNKNLSNYVKIASTIESDYYK